MAKPQIRLKGFEGEWEKFELNQIFQERHVISTITPDLPQLSFTIEEGIIKPENRKSNKRDFLIKDKTNKKYLVTLLNDIIYNPANVIHGAIHKNSLCNGVVSPIYKIFYTDQNANFLDCIVRRKNFIKEISKYMEGTVLKLRTLKPESFLKMSIYIGSVNEQIVIADYFKSLDTMLQSTTKKIESLKQMKQACLVSMFPQAGETTPRVRFKGFEGEWGCEPLRSFSKKVIKKNQNLEYRITLTNSAEYGIINQLDFFDHDVSNGDNIRGYYIVENDDFVYNPRISASAPVGPINRNQLGYAGVMSPLYYVFRVYGMSKDYLSVFFKTTLWHKFMKDNGNSGARFDRLSITDDVFVQMPISYPKDIQEQQQIASFFTSLDKQISLQEKRLEKLKQIKAACLDKMFV